MTPDEGTFEGEAAPRDPVLGRLAPRWGATRTEDNLAVTFQRLERAARARRAGVAGALALGAVALAAWGVRGRGAPTVALAPRASEASVSRRLELPDGSKIALADAGARAVVSRSSSERLELELSGGPAAFDVPARTARTVVVRTARIEVAILAAKFDLTPVGERVRVSVGEGEVAVTWPGADAPAKVRAGEGSVFPPAAPPAAVAAEPPAEGPPAAEPAARAGARSRFRLQVARRDYAGAYRSLVAAPGVAEHSAEDLMLAADAARLSGHPAAAVPFLRRLLREHEADVRAPVAAFTLGRVLLADLARPAEAADAFALSARLAPRGPLAADALGREVEAAARAGDAARARRVAEAYVARFPDGARTAEVRRAGGLE